MIRDSNKVKRCCKGSVRSKEVVQCFSHWLGETPARAKSNRNLDVERWQILARLYQLAYLASLNWHTRKHAASSVTAELSIPQHAFIMRDGESDNRERVERA